ncbi:MAG TPA: hypothetical protein VG711_03640 [Phycisphaerales bacterium]|nr:hypothetical protein [Phycisphaerales bacterium]
MNRPQTNVFAGRTEAQELRGSDDRRRGEFSSVDVVDLAQRIGLPDDAIKALSTHSESDGVAQGTFNATHGEAMSRHGRFHQMIEQIAKQLGVDPRDLMRQIRQRFSGNGHAGGQDTTPVQLPTPVEVPDSGASDESDSTTDSASTPVEDAPGDSDQGSAGQTDSTTGTDGATVPDDTNQSTGDAANTGATSGNSSNGSATSSSNIDVSNLQHVTGTGQTVVLDNQSNKLVSGISVNGVPNGIMVNNNQTSNNVVVDGFSATNVTEYGMYLGDVNNWTIRNVTLSQGEGAYQHGLRVAQGTNLTMSNVSIDTTKGGKSSLWLLDVDNANLDGLTIKGGAIRFGARPGDNLGSPTPTNITLSNSTIIKTGGGDSEAIHVWPGSDSIHLENLDITLTTSENWLSIDSRNVTNITWSNVRVNGQLVTGFDGVNLGGMTEEEALAKGIHAE